MLLLKAHFAKFYFFYRFASLSIIDNIDWLFIFVVLVHWWASCFFCRPCVSFYYSHTEMGSRFFIWHYIVKECVVVCTFPPALFLQVSSCSLNADVFCCLCSSILFSVLSLYHPLSSFSPLKLSSGVVEWRDGPTHKYEQTHPQAFLAVWGLREPVSTTQHAPGSPRSTTAPSKGSISAGPYDQPTAVSPEDPDEEPVEAPLRLAISWTCGRLQAELTGGFNAWHTTTNSLIYFFLFLSCTLSLQHTGVFVVSLADIGTSDAPSVGF